MRRVLVFIIGVVQLDGLGNFIQVSVCSIVPRRRTAHGRFVHDLIVSLEPLTKPGRLGDFEKEENVHDNYGQVGDQLDQYELGPEDVVLHVSGVLSQFCSFGERYAFSVDLRKDFLTGFVISGFLHAHYKASSASSLKFTFQFSVPEAENLK